MGCFSWICPKCGKPINSDSTTGENAILILYFDGKMVECMEGQYDSYGRVFDREHNSTEWVNKWGDICTLMFEKSNNDPEHKTGLMAFHQGCWPNVRKERYQDYDLPKDDPDQGWGDINKSNCYGCFYSHEVKYLIDLSTMSLTPYNKEVPHMAEMKTVEAFYREDQDRECKLTHHACDLGDCRHCVFAQEAFRYELQMKLEAHRREEAAKLAQVKSPEEPESEEPKTKGRKK